MANPCNVRSEIVAFAKAMKARLHEKVRVGYCGWDGAHSIGKFCEEIAMDAHVCLVGSRTGENVAPTAVDIGARAMMIWFRERVS